MTSVRNRMGEESARNILIITYVGGIANPAPLTSSTATMGIPTKMVADIVR